MVMYRDRRHGKVTETRGRRGVNLKRQAPELGDTSLAALSETCPDCKASPFEPCHSECSSHWV